MLFLFADVFLSFYENRKRKSLLTVFLSLENRFDNATSKLYRSYGEYFY